ncbi:hypothetical protein [Ectobacillus ponti]|uniref:Uncharacterized protein n=1 Tax=Ectobacillus ponti TaxID=2961894 RepID=A0AA41X8C2_9BACI|nr:hypothetical protein [Ectobacillus ponti]MCP8968554.1 hypothetical protein [Ectobacillus ponti]
MDEEIWEELRRLHERVQECERKLEEKLQGCPCWHMLKHIVYASQIIAPAWVLLIKISDMLLAETLARKEFEYCV